jgi:hypothetical protein
LQSTGWKWENKKDVDDDEKEEMKCEVEDDL